MKKIATILIPVALLLAGCVSMVTPEEAAKVDLQKSGMVLATFHQVGNVEDVKKVAVEFYIRPTVGRGNVLKDLVVNSGKDLWLMDMPPGRYKIADWFIGAGTMRRESSEAGFEFEVRTGEITYIGNFEVQVARAKNVFGMNVIPFATPVLKDEFEVDLATFKSRYPSLSDVAVRNVAPTNFTWVETEERAVPLYIPIPATE